MSYYYTKIKAILDTNNSTIHNFYVEYAITKLTETKNPRKNSFILYNDLEHHLKTYPCHFKLITQPQNNDCKIEFIEDKNNENAIHEIKNRLFYLKALHIRAIILDLIENDYTSDEPFYKPDKWIYEVMEEIENTFSGLEDCMKEFNLILVEEWKNIFLSRNKKLGYNGNLLVMNFIVYKKWVKDRFEYSFDDFFEIFGQGFVEGRRMGIEEISAILDEYEKKRKDEENDK